MAVKAIGPDDIAEYKSKVIPDFVLEAVNELLALNYVDGRATIYQRDIISLAKVKRGDNMLQDFDNKWLNFEEVYRAAGWRVTYDKPGYNESYPASFDFRKK